MSNCGCKEIKRYDCVSKCNDDPSVVNVGVLEPVTWDAADTLLGLDAEKKPVRIQKPDFTADVYTREETDTLLDQKVGADDIEAAMEPVNEVLRTTLKKGVGGTYTQGVDFTDLQTFLDEKVNNKWFDSSITININQTFNGDINIYNVFNHISTSSLSIRPTTKICNTLYINNVTSINIGWITYFGVMASILNIINCSRLILTPGTYSNSIHLTNSHTSIIGYMEYPFTTNRIDVYESLLYIDYVGSISLGSLRNKSIILITERSTNIKYGGYQELIEGIIVDNRPGNPNDTFVRKSKFDEKILLVSDSSDPVAESVSHPDSVVVYTSERYMRMYYNGFPITDNSGELVPVMRSSVLPAPFSVSASSGSDTAYLVFSKSVGDGYAWEPDDTFVDGAGDSWIGIKLDVARVVTKLFFALSVGYANGTHVFHFSGSNDGENFTDVFVGDHLTYAELNGRLEATCGIPDTGVAYQYYRIITYNIDSAVNVLRMESIRLFGY